MDISYIGLFAHKKNDIAVQKVIFSKKHFPFQLISLARPPRPSANRRESPWRGSKNPGRPSLLRPAQITGSSLIAGIIHEGCSPFQGGRHGSALAGFQPLGPEAAVALFPKSRDSRVLQQPNYPKPAGRARIRRKRNNCSRKM
jgi:hypothetical protein